MPHSNHNTHASSTGDDLGSTDEVKIFKDEGDREDEKISSENLLEEKSSLIDLTESEEKSVKNSTRHDLSPVYGKETHSHAASFNMGYLSISPYSYANGAAGIPVSMANKMMPFFCHNGDHLTSPPPAHCGIAPYQLDPKAIGLSRPALYSFPPSQYPYPMLSPDMSQVAASWHTPSMYSAAPPGFRNSYSTSLQINTTLPSDFYRFSPTTLIPSVHSHHVLNSGIIPTSIKQDPGAESMNNRHNNEQKSGNCTTQSETKDNSNNDKKKPHIKKPLNAFMLYMKEMRAKVVAECTLKESAAINQILGRKWHSLSRDEQSIYYDKARQERQLHMELYPGWSARDNYGYGSKKKKRKKDRSPADSGGNNMKKCRARYGLDQQNQWCKPCRRKKKCIRYKETENDDGMHVSDENLGSCGSVEEAHTPDDDVESLNQSLSSPGCLSGLSSLQSPSTSLASPLNLLASPSTPLNFYHTETPANSQSLNINSSFSNNTSRNSSNTSTNNGSHSNNNSSNNNINNNNNHSDNDENVDDNNNENDDDSGGLERNEPPPHENERRHNNNHHHHHQQQEEENGSSRSREIPTSSSSSSLLFSKPIMNDYKLPLSSKMSNSSTSSSSSISPLLSLSLSPSTSSSSSALLSNTSSTSSTSKLPINYFNRNDFKMKNPVGANPRDVNNPLSINQLTKRDFITNQYNSLANHQQDFLNANRYQHSPFHHHHHHHHHSLNHNFSLPQLPVVTPNFQNAAVAVSVVSMTPASNALSSVSSTMHLKSSTKNDNGTSAGSKQKCLGVDDGAISVL